MSDDVKTKPMPGIPGLRSLPARIAYVALMVLNAVICTYDALHYHSPNGPGWWTAGLFWLMTGIWGWWFLGPRKGSVPDPFEPISLNLNKD